MNVTPKDIRTWSRLGQRGTIFAITLPEIAEKADNLKLLTADLAILSGMDRYMTNYPDKFLNVGIAEQNLIGIGAGLAMEGYCVFATTYASFIAVRSLEHVRQHLSYLQCNVKIIGSSAGVVAAKSGVSHWATEDLAFTRALPNLTVFSPADSLEAMKIIDYASKKDGPMYIRLSGGLNCPIVYKEDYEFIPGKLIQLNKGEDIAIIATGLMVNEALKAERLLNEKGLSCSVFNMHTIKPIDKTGLENIFKKYKMIVTVEEHNVFGGMGSAVAEYKAVFQNTPKQVFIGFQDSYADAGSQRFIWEQVGLTDELIAKRIIEEWSKVNDR